MWQHAVTYWLLLFYIVLWIYLVHSVSYALTGLLKIKIIISFASLHHQ